MYCVSVNLSSYEWLRIHQSATKQWPTETLSRAEIIRRYALIGIKSFSNLSSEARADQTRDLQQSIHAPDERLRH